MPSAREPPAESRDPWCRGSGETTAEASTRREHRSGTACCCRPRRPRSTAAESMIDPRRRSRQQPQPRARRRLPRAARQLRGLRVGAVQVLLNRRVRGEECRTKPVIDGRRPAHGGPANRARRTVARRTVARPTVAWNGCLANGIRRTVSGERYPANGIRRMALGEWRVASRSRRAVRSGRTASSCVLQSSDIMASLPMRSAATVSARLGSRGCSARQCGRFADG
jgi:hypothetical protein